MLILEIIRKRNKKTSSKYWRYGGHESANKTISEHYLKKMLVLVDHSRLQPAFETVLGYDGKGAPHAVKCSGAAQ